MPGNQSDHGADGVRRLGGHVHGEVVVHLVVVYHASAGLDGSHMDAEMCICSLTTTSAAEQFFGIFHRGRLLPSAPDLVGFCPLYRSAVPAHPDPGTL